MNSAESSNINPLTATESQTVGGSNGTPVAAINMRQRINKESSKDEAIVLKTAAIEDACDKQDIASLAKLAVSDKGLVLDDLRRRVWPILLGLPEHTDDRDGLSDNPLTTASLPNWQSLPEHKDEDQVGRDVDRSFVYYPKDLADKELEARKSDLSTVIVGTLRRFPMLCYFQGFHDIVQVLLLVLGRELSAEAVPYLSLLRIRDFMLPSLSPSLSHLQLVPAILFSADRELYGHVHKAQPYFALASTLTLYAHEVQDYTDIARLFDFLLAKEAAITLYFFSAIVLSRKKELMDIPLDEPEMLHFMLSKLPHPLDLESLIQKTLDLFQSHPPEKLPFGIWRRISSDSVLKSTRRDAASGSRKTHHYSTNLEEATACFQRQAVQLRRQELRERVYRNVWCHRRAIGGVSTALLVAALSFWLQRRGPTGDTPQLAKRLWGMLPAWS